MINGRTVLAVIPARSGSKRCPGKNFLEYRGKRLVDWALEHARGSAYIDQVIYSTDDARPPELCTDTATCEDVMRYHQARHPHDWIVLLQPTSPLRTSEDIDRCIERAQMGEACIAVGMDGKPCGAVYVASADYLARHDFSYGATMKYVMPQERCLDINLPEDFDR